MANEIAQFGNWEYVSDFKSRTVRDNVTFLLADVFSTMESKGIILEDEMTDLEIEVIVKARPEYRVGTEVGTVGVKVTRKSLMHGKGVEADGN